MWPLAVRRGSSVQPDDKTRWADQSAMRICCLFTCCAFFPYLDWPLVAPLFVKRNSWVMVIIRVKRHEKYKQTKCESVVAVVSFSLRNTLSRAVANTFTLWVVSAPMLGGTGMAQWWKCSPPTNRFKHDVYGKRQKWHFCGLSSVVCTVEWNYLYLQWIVGDVIPFLCALFTDKKKKTQNQVLSLPFAACR